MNDKEFQFMMDNHLWCPTREDMEREDGKKYLVAEPVILPNGHRVMVTNHYVDDGSYPDLDGAPIYYTLEEAMEIHSKYESNPDYYPIPAVVSLYVE